MGVAYLQSRDRQGAFAVKHYRKEKIMLLVLAVILLVAWMMGFVAFHVASGLVHLLLLIALVAFVMHFVTGRRVV